MKTTLISLSILFVSGLFLLSSCQQENLEHSITDISIKKSQTIEDFHIPFGNSEEMKSYSKDNKNVVDYELARKIALLEIKESGFIENMGWQGYTISEKPVVIYDLNSMPKYYDFIAIDAENTPIGTIRLNATKKNNSTIIHASTIKLSIITPY